MTTLKQLDDRLDRDRSHLRDFKEYAVKCADLQRIMHRNGNHMNWRSFIPQSEVASFLADYFVTEVFQRPDQTICGYAAWQFHAASTGISSSFT